MKPQFTLQHVAVSILVALFWLTMLWLQYRQDKLAELVILNSEAHRGALIIHGQALQSIFNALPEDSTESR